MENRVTDPPIGILQILILLVTKARASATAENASCFALICGAFSLLRDNVPTASAKMRSNEIKIFPEVFGRKAPASSEN